MNTTKPESEPEKHQSKRIFIYGNTTKAAEEKEAVARPTAISKPTNQAVYRIIGGK